jgi:hypothetical protein
VRILCNNTTGRERCWIKPAIPVKLCDLSQSEPAVQATPARDTTIAPRTTPGDRHLSSVSVCVPYVPHSLHWPSQHFTQ